MPPLWPALALHASGCSLHTDACTPCSILAWPLRRKTTAEQRRRWDLSNLQFIMSGAEPIRAETMSAFFGAFADSGLKASVFCSAYGLAEHVCGAFPLPNCQPSLGQQLQWQLF